VNLPPSRQDWPSLGAMVTRFRAAPPGLPANVQIPYPLVDNNTLQAGENAGWLGNRFDPVIVRPDRGRPWGGVSGDLGTLVLNRADNVDAQRLQGRQSLVQRLAPGFSQDVRQRTFGHFQQMAFDILVSPDVQAAFNLDREPLAVRA